MTYLIYSIGNQVLFSFTAYQSLYPSGGSFFFIHYYFCNHKPKWSHSHRRCSQGHLIFKKHLLASEYPAGPAIHNFPTEVRIEATSSENIKPKADAENGELHLQVQSRNKRLFQSEDKADGRDYKAHNKVAHPSHFSHLLRTH